MKDTHFIILFIGNAQDGQVHRERRWVVAKGWRDWIFSGGHLRSTGVLYGIMKMFYNLLW